MYLGSWKIDDFLTFPANTHTASTGAATDADAVPAYRVYEDESGTPVLTGSMALLDGTNTTGFYSERIQLTVASGFEAGKTYTIYISAAVATITGTISHSFQIQAEVALHADWLNGGRLDLLIDAIKVSTDDWLDAGRLDVILDAINAKTVNLPADPADQSLIIAATNAITAMLTDIQGAGFSSVVNSLKAIRDRGDVGWITAIAAGTGSVSWPYTVTDAVGGLPISGVKVEVSTDASKGNVVALGYTDNFGTVTFFLNPGTYYIFRSKAGWDFSDPDTEIVT